MDATMVAMRSASEQQLTHACLSHVDASPRRDEHSPSVESLMTLLWAIHVMEGERAHEKTPRLDAATEVRQACSELDELFRLRNIKTKGVPYLSREHDGGMGKKSLEGWRTAFKHDRP